MTVSVWTSDRPQRVKAHTVLDIRFSHNARADTAPVTCSCGWTGIVGEWSAHSGKLVRRAWSEPETCELVACGRAHEMTKANTYTDPQGRPRCLTCQHDANRRYHARKREAMAAA